MLIERPPLTDQDQNLETQGHADVRRGGLKAALRTRGGAQFEPVPKSKTVLPERDYEAEVWAELELLWKALVAPSATSEGLRSSTPAQASESAQASLRDVLRSRGGVQLDTSQKPLRTVETQPSVREKVTQFLGALAPDSGSSDSFFTIRATNFSGTLEAQPSVADKVTDFLGALAPDLDSSNISTTFASLTNGVSTLFEGTTTSKKKRKVDQPESLASVLRRRGGALAEDGYENFFEYRSEHQHEGATAICQKDCKKEENLPAKEQKHESSLAAVLRRRGGSVDEDGFETFFEYKKEETPKENPLGLEGESPWANQVRKNLKKPQSFHLPENDVDVDSPQQGHLRPRELLDVSRFAHLQSLWESRIPYAGAGLNETTRMSKTEAQSALQRLSMKGFFGPGDLDEVRKLRQALLVADEEPEAV